MFCYLDSQPDYKTQEFDFLILGELLRTPVLELLESKNENTVSLT